MAARTGHPSSIAVKEKKKDKTKKRNISARPTDK